MSQLIRQFLEKIRSQSKKIHCFGDAMVDEYSDVKLTRISPEYPIPVMLNKSSTKLCPGGAANVANQLKFLNVDVQLTCFNDPTAVDVFQQNNINVACATDVIKGCKLSHKQRFLDEGIQVLARFDSELHNSGLNEKALSVHAAQLESMLSKMKMPDVAILSDYSKGFFSAVPANFIDILNRRGVKTIVDPKSLPISLYRGCTVFKPNRSEAEKLSGYTDWKQQVGHFVSELNCEAVVITRSEEGVCGWHKGKLFEIPGVENVDVRSVIGAGDCFAAYFAAAIAHDFSVQEAATIAFKAGTTYVKYQHNRPVTPVELVDDKLVHPADLRNIDGKLVFTNGCFDILHSGHIANLKYCKSLGDKLVVALNSDSSIKRLKGPARPILPLEDRLAVISSLEFVDYVIVFDEDTPYEVIKQCEPDVLCKSKYDPDKIVGADLVKQVVVGPTFGEKSTTALIEAHLRQLHSTH